MRGARGSIQLFSLGGTITQGPGGTLKPASLIRMATWLPGDVAVRGVAAELVDAPVHIEEALAKPGCIGVVVAMDFGDLVWLLGKLSPVESRSLSPIVLTGASIAPRLAGTDAPGNIAEAIRVACDENARGLGVLVVAQGRVHAASEVRFVPGETIQPLRSEPFGPIGLVSVHGVEIVRRPGDRHGAGGGVAGAG